MRRLAGIAAIALLLEALACSSGGDLLPAGTELGGFSDVDKPESYNSATLYTYMDGGAEFYIKQGFVGLYVRRYARGAENFVAELYQMKDAQSAAALYGATRRPEVEKEVAGHRASVSPAEIILAKGRCYLVCRNDDPMATDNTSLVDLCAKVARRIPTDG